MAVNNLNYLPHSVGFDRSFKLLTSMLDGLEKPLTYPPYNIVKTAEDQYQIEIALAGFSMGDIDVTVEDNILTVKGEMKKADRDYVYKGISEREFNRQFTLVDTIEVLDAMFNNGILVIRLKNVIPEHKKPRKILLNNPAIPPGTMMQE